MAKNQRAGRRRGQRARPSWLEVGGQQRLRRLHAGLQVRRQRLQRWSDWVEEIDDEIVDRLHGKAEPQAYGRAESRTERPERTSRARTGYYDTGGEEVSSPGKGKREIERPAESTEEPGRTGPRPTGSAWPSRRRRSASAFGGGYDTDADDVTGTRVFLRSAGEQNVDGGPADEPGEKPATSRSSRSRPGARKTAATKKSTRSSSARKRSSS